LRDATIACKITIEWVQPWFCHTLQANPVLTGVYLWEVGQGKHVGKDYEKGCLQGVVRDVQIVVETIGVIPAVLTIALG
jgi:hypothetical protein